MLGGVRVHSTDFFYYLKAMAKNNKNKTDKTTKVPSPPRKENKSAVTKLHNAITLAYVRDILHDEGGIGYDV